MSKEHIRRAMSYKVGSKVFGFDLLKAISPSQSSNVHSTNNKVIILEIKKSRKTKHI
jgi:hypothetical protein